MRYSSSNRGFTLIEIIVVLALISVAGSLVFMNIGKSGRLRESRIFAEKMVSMCREARSAALGTGVPACMTISPGSRECYVGFMASALPYRSNEDKSETSANSLPPEYRGHEVLTIPEKVLIEGERVDVSDDGYYSICFYPDGSSGGGEITISVPDEFKYTFQVEILTGSVRDLPPSGS